MVGRKRKVAPEKAKHLEAKHTKVEDDIDDFIKDLSSGQMFKQVNSNSSHANGANAKIKPEIIEFTIKESICEDLNAIQIAVNNAIDLKNKVLTKKVEDVKKLSDEKADLLKALGKAEEMFNTYDADLKHKDNQIRTLEDLLTNIKSKSNEESKAKLVKIEKLTKNIEILLKENKVLTTAYGDLKEEVNSKEIGIKKCKNDFNLFRLKIDQFLSAKKQQEEKVQTQTKEIFEKDKMLKEFEIERTLKEIEKEKMLRELENRRLQDNKVLQEKIKGLKYENRINENASKDMRDRGQTMQKLIDAEKKLSNKLKRELKLCEEQHNAETLKVIERLQGENAALKKKSYERKLKLKFAQQSYKTNLSDYINKYEKNIDRLRSKLEKGKVKKKKNEKSLTAKSLKLVLGGNISKQSFDSQFEDHFVVKKVDKHPKTQKAHLEAVEQEQTDLEKINNLSHHKSSCTTIPDYFLDFSDQDVPTTSQNHLQNQSSLKSNLETSALEIETPHEENVSTSSRSKDFCNFVVLDDSSFVRNKETLQNDEHENENTDEALIGTNVDSKQPNPEDQIQDFMLDQCLDTSDPEVEKASLKEMVIDLLYQTVVKEVMTQIEETQNDEVDEVEDHIIIMESEAKESGKDINISDMELLDVTLEDTETNQEMEQTYCANLAEIDAYFTIGKTEKLVRVKKGGSTYVLEQNKDQEQDQDLVVESTELVTDTSTEYEATQCNARAEEFDKNAFAEELISMLLDSVFSLGIDMSQVRSAFKLL